MSIRLHEEFGVNPSILVCHICGESDALVLLGHNNGKEAPREITHYSMKGEKGKKDTKHTHCCQECEKMMEMGIVLVECKDDTEDDPYRTGRIFCISEEAFDRIFDIDLGSHRLCHVPEEVIKLIGIEDIEPLYDEVPA